MPIHDIYSKRQKRLRGEVSDVFEYELIPETLRVQILHIISDCTGNMAMHLYQYVHKTLCREYGLFELANTSSVESNVTVFFRTVPMYEQALDVIEVSFQFIDKVTRIANFDRKPLITVDDAIFELNTRFKEHGIGYQFVSGELIRMDSTYTHSEIVLPVLRLLNSKSFDGANEEYLKAHEHYRHRRNKECLAECLKAFESTLKIICTEKRWEFDQNDPSKKLINVCFANNLVPKYMQNQFTSLQNLIESGIPTLRNKLGAHGQGQTPQEVDDHIARYGLNLTGSNIIFLIEQSGIT